MFKYCDLKKKSGQHWIAHTDCSHNDNLLTFQNFISHCWLFYFKMFLSLYWLSKLKFWNKAFDSSSYSTKSFKFWSHNNFKTVGGVIILLLFPLIQCERKLLILATIHKATFQMMYCNSWLLKKWRRRLFNNIITTNRWTCTFWKQSLQPIQIIYDNYYSAEK